MNALGKRAGFLALVLVMSTALVGAAYTLWYEDVQISTHVTTGELDGRIECGVRDDNEDESGWTNVPPADSYPQADPLKDVADPVIGDGTDPHNYVLTLSNVYPGYMADCELHILNTGTVPWHIEMEQIVVTEGATTVLTGQCDAPNPFSQGECWAGDISPTDPDGEPLYVEFSDLRGCQVHEGNQKVGSIFIGVNQSAEESTTYTVILKFRIQQWNESYWHNCGDPRADPPSGPPPQFPT